MIKGKKHSKETKRKISEANKGRIVSKETRNVWKKCRTLIKNGKI